jgi:hypothetical protein
MTEQRRNPRFTRRGALAGLGIAGLGGTIPAASVAAQEATPDTASHPVVGLWQNQAGPPPALKDPVTFCIFHADGTYLGWDGLNVGLGLGIWRSTGANTAELLFIVRDTTPRDLTETPGTGTFRMTVEVGDTGDAMTFNGEIVVRSPEGYSIVTLPDAQWTANRVSFDRNPASPETEATPPAG